MTTSIEIDVRAHHDEIHRIVQHYGLPLESIEIVPSIQNWCEERGLPENNPFRIARIVRNIETGRYVILFAESLTKSMVSAVESALEQRGFGSELSQLADACGLVRHLTLHEIAHGLDAGRSEYDCDRWAFDQLGTSLFDGINVQSRIIVKDWTK